MTEIDALVARLRESLPYIPGVLLKQDVERACVLLERMAPPIDIAGLSSSSGSLLVAHPCKVCGASSAFTFCSDDCEKAATGAPQSKADIREVLTRLTRAQRLNLHVLRTEHVLKKTNEEHRHGRTRTFF